MKIYGKKEHVRYFCTDLLWGQKLYQELRFILVEYRGVQGSSAGMDTSLDLLVAIRLYSYRFSGLSALSVSSSGSLAVSVIIFEQKPCRS